MENEVNFANNDETYIQGPCDDKYVWSDDEAHGRKMERREGKNTGVGTEKA